MLYYICLTTTISLSLIDNNELYMQYEISRNYYTFNIIYTHLLVIFFVLYRDKETQDVWMY